jgi:hypothetical protein
VAEAHVASQATSARRVVVAIDPLGVRLAPLELAARIASDAGLGLTALVVEEEALVRLASLPFTQELRLSSGSWQSFEAADVERGFRRHARRVEQLLEEVARRFGVTGRVSIERGTFPRRALEASSPADLLVVDRMPRPGAITRYRRIVVAYQPGDEHAAALRAAGRLAAAVGLPLRVLLPAAEAALAAPLRAAADSLLPGARPEYVSVAASGPRAQWLRRALQQADAALLVIADGSGRPDEAAAGRGDIVAAAAAAGARDLSDACEVCIAAGCTVLLVREGW